MGQKSSGAERVAWAIGTGGASEVVRNPTTALIGPAGAMLAGTYKGGTDILNAPSELAPKQMEEQNRIMQDMANQAASQKAAADKEAADALAKEQQGLEMKTAKQRQARLAMGAKGRQDTILTGPLGLTASGSKSGKTLLGY